MAIVMWFVNFNYSFPVSDCDIVYNHGAIPHLTWEPWKSQLTDKLLPDILSGSYDTYLKNWADATKNWGHPLFIRFGHEMNGNWYGWSGYYNGQDTKTGYGDPNEEDGPEIYRDAFRYVVDIFNNEGASNVAWVWSPNNGSTPNTAWNQVDKYYPGDHYVDWLGFSAYNWGDTTPSWDSIVSNIYTKLMLINNTKPIMWAEGATGLYGNTTTEKLQNKADWITNAFHRICTSYPNIQAYNWFHKNKEEDWRIDGEQPTNAMRWAMKNLCYTSVGDTGNASLPWNGLTVIDDFEDGDGLNLLGGQWTGVDDSGEGGNSSISPVGNISSFTDAGAVGSSNSCKFDYTLGSAISYRYVIMETAIPQWYYDFSQFNSIRFYIKGNGHKLKIVFATTNIHDGDYFSYTIPSTPTNWTLYSIAFSDFNQDGSGIAKDRNQSFHYVNKIKFTPSSKINGETDTVYLDNILLDTNYYDIMSPGPITNLSGSQGAFAGEVDLNWTSSGDDGIVGTATLFDVRYSSSPINSMTDFSNALPVSGEPIPQISGTPQSMTVKGLNPGVAYYFVIVAYDEANNPSPLSNIACVTSSTNVPYLGLIIDDCEDGDNINFLDGFWTTLNDSGSGGNSVVLPLYGQNVMTNDGANGTTMSAHCSYTLKSAIANPYSMIYTTITNTNLGGYLNFNDYGGIDVWLKGNGKLLKIKLASENISDYDYYQYTLTTSTGWSNYSIPFNNFSQEGWGNAVALTNGLKNIFQIQFSSKSETAGEVGKIMVDELSLMSKDIMPPSAITNFNGIAGRWAGEVDLTWIAPGNNWNAGTASYYDIRYSTNEILGMTEFSNAIEVTNEPTPSVAGSQETLTVQGLIAGKYYYFAIISYDDQGNQSALSKVIYVMASDNPPWTGFIIDTCEDGDNWNELDGWWTTVDDSANSGNSTVFPIMNDPVMTNGGADGTLYSARMHYTLGPAYQYRYALLSTSIPSSNQNFYSQGATGIHFYLKGDGHSMRVVIESSNILDNDQYGYLISSTPNNWTEYSISFKYFTQEGWGTTVALSNALKKITQIKFVANSQESNESGMFFVDEIWIDGPDVTPPDAISDLSATPGQYQGEVLLGWHATGDDKMQGGAYHYDIRYSTNQINSLSDFSNAQIYTNIIQPLVAGSYQSTIIEDLIPGKLYYFAIVVVDDVGNRSDLSNIASAIGSTAPPIEGVWIDRFEDGDSTSELGTPWETFSGNGSSINASILSPGADGSSYCGYFDHDTATGSDNYAGEKCAMNSISSNWWDGYESIRLWVKFTNNVNGSLRIQADSPVVTDYDYYGYNIPFEPGVQWREITIPITNFSQAGWGIPVDRSNAMRHVASFSILAHDDNSVGKVYFDQITLLKPAFIPPTIPPLLVLTNTPIAEETNVALTQKIHIVFNTNIDSSTVNGSSFYVFDSDGNSMSGSYTITNNIVNFTPTGQYTPNDYITVTITTSVHSISTNKLALDYVFSFYTAPGTTTAHTYNTINIADTKVVTDWDFNNPVTSIDYGTEITENLLPDEGSTGNYNVCGLSVTWDSNRLYINLRRYYEGTAHKYDGGSFYDIIALDVTRDNIGADSYGELNTDGGTLQFPLDYRKPDYIFVLDHDGTGNGWTSGGLTGIRKWTGTTWVTQGSAGTDFDVDTSAYSEWEELWIDWDALKYNGKLPNRISIGACEFDAYAAGAVDDWAPDSNNPGQILTNWLTFDPDNDGNEIPDVIGSGSSGNFFVTLSSPSNREQNVTISSESFLACVSFNTDVNASSVDNVSFYVRDSDGNIVSSATGYPQVNGTNILWKPASNLKSSEWYTMVITTNIKSIANDKISFESYLTFSSGPGDETLHSWNTINIADTKAVTDWDFSNDISSADNGTIHTENLLPDEGATGTYNVCGLSVTWDSNRLYINIRRYYEGTGHKYDGASFYDVIALDVTRDDSGADSYDGLSTDGGVLQFPSDYRKPEYMFILDHDGTGNGWTSGGLTGIRKWTGSSWIVQGSVGTDFDVDTSTYSEWEEFWIDWDSLKYNGKLPNRISIVGCEFDAYSGGAVDDWAPDLNNPGQQATHWVTFDPDNNDDEIPDNGNSRANFSVTKQADVQIANPGSKVTFQIDYNSSGGVTASNVIIKDVIPVDLTYTGNSLKFGATSQDYVSASVLSDSTGDDIGSYDGVQCVFTPDNGTAPTTGGEVNVGSSGRLWLQTYLSQKLAGSFTTNIIVATGKNFSSITNFFVLKTGTNYGGRLNFLEDVLYADFPNTYYYQCSLTNKGNVPTDYHLSIPYTNSSINLTNWDIAIVNQNNGLPFSDIFNLSPNDFYNFRIRIIPPNIPGAWIEFRLLAKMTSGDITATNYLGEDGVVYGGDVGEDWNGVVLSSYGGDIYQQNNPEVRLTLQPPFDLQIVHSVSNITLHGISSKYIPGATIFYKVKYTNRGEEGKKATIKIEINSNTKFVSGSMTTITGWTSEYSSVLLPIDDFNSADFTTTESSNIKWIRWKHHLLPTGNSGIFTYKVIIK